VIRPALLIVGGSALLAVASCQHAPKPAPVVVDDALRARDLYPLRVGNAWTYEIRTSGQSVLRSIEITAEQDGYFLDSKAGRLREDARGLRDGDRYLIENPIQAGHKWFSVVSVQSTEEFEITEAGHPCTVQAGTFGRCVTVRATSSVDADRSLALVSTYAEGVGLVSLHTEQATAGKTPVPQLDMELVTYKLAP